MVSSTSVAILFLLLVQYSVTSYALFVPLQRAYSLCPADSQEKWSYRGKNGADYWGNTYPKCNGESQSPIEINSGDVEQDENLAQLEMNNYNEPVSKATIVNNGHTIQLNPTDGVERSIEVGGSTYTLRQLHFHWGTDFSKGSEHLLDGKQYAAEMHLVHMNENNEIAVVGVMYDEEFNDNEEMQSIVNALPELRYKDTETELATPLNLNNLVPENPATYYRYSGSLTTPGCAEGVTWSVLKKPLKIGNSQMSKFRDLYSATKQEAVPACRLSNNFRPVQQLNGRQVLLSQ